MKRQSIRVLSGFVIVACLVLNRGTLLAQAAGTDATGNSRAAQSAEQEGVAGEMQQLRAMIEQLRQENQTSRAEMRQLREELQKTQSLLEQLTTARAAEAPAPASTFV